MLFIKRNLDCDQIDEIIIKQKFIKYLKELKGKKFEEDIENLEDLS